MLVLTGPKGANAGSLGAYFWVGTLGVSNACDWTWVDCNRLPLQSLIQAKKNAIAPRPEYLNCSRLERKNITSQERITT